MCGRMAITLPKEAMAKLFNAVPANDLPILPNYNVCPTDKIHSVVSHGSVRHIKAMRWGFLPHWYRSQTGGPLLINARSETIDKKPAFREACRYRRCIIPADGFYEWARKDKHKPVPYRVTMSDGGFMAMAGIWQNWEIDGVSITTCAIITTQANAKMAKIHHRLPVILRPKDWPLWLGEAGKGAAKLMQPVSNEVLKLQRVDDAVNSNLATGAQLWAKIKTKTE